LGDLHPLTGMTMGMTVSNSKKRPPVSRLDFSVLISFKRLHYFWIYSTDKAKKTDWSTEG